MRYFVKVFVLLKTVCIIVDSQSIVNVNRPGISATSRPATRITIDNSIPGPTQLRKLRSSAQSLTLTYTPPPGYLNDARYRHFWVRYGRYDDTRGNSWQSREILKSSNPNSLILTDLQSGFLYNITIQSRRRNLLNYQHSPVTSQTLARTNPQPQNFTVSRSPGNWSHAVLSWVRSPSERLRNNYDSLMLTYYIQGLTPSQQLIYPVKNETIYPPGVLQMFQPIRTTLMNLEKGATYVYNLVTYSGGPDGVDKTFSSTVTVLKTLGIPGPTNLTKTATNSTSLSLTWDRRLGVGNITGYVMSYQRVQSTETSENITLQNTSATISNLLPGTIYAIRIMALRENSLFGRTTDFSIAYFRTQPAKAENLRVTRHTETIIQVAFNPPSVGDYTDYRVRYQTSDKRTIMTTLPRSSERNATVNLLNLKPGALYNIEVVVYSRQVLFDDETRNSVSILARTNPTRPRNVTGFSARGTIYLSWQIPSGIYPRAVWRYKIDYYEVGLRNESRTMCQMKGQNFQTVLLTGLSSGVGYYVTMSTVAGGNCSANVESDDVTYSRTTEPILLYTQPSNPVIDFWKQITLDTVRVKWDEPGARFSRFDNFIVSVRSVPTSKNSVPYRRERFSVDVNKDKTSYDIKLTQGLHYQVNLTTVAGFGASGKSSVVVPGVNSITFKTWYPYSDHSLNPILRWKFNNCGRNGRRGPSQLQCDVSYSGTSLEQTVEVRNGIQYWKAPIEGLYRIVAAGAGYQGAGGLGATVSGLFHLKQGAGLMIGVGQRGVSRGETMTEGGAGGTFVVAEGPSVQGIDEANLKEAMLVAGGGGSAEVGLQRSVLSNAQLKHNAANASSIGIGFGLGGKGDVTYPGPGQRGSFGTGGGAGLYGIAGPAVIADPTDTVYPAVGFYPFQGNGETMNMTERMKYTPLYGGRVDRLDFTFSEGGFGGGGAGYLTGAGGGGGYSGGGGGSPGGYSGGAGSYIKFTGGEQQAELTNDQPGFVVISVVGLPSTSPIPVTLYLVISFVVGICMTLICGGGLFGVAKCTDKYMDKMEMADKRLTEGPVSTNYSTTFDQLNIDKIEESTNTESEFSENSDEPVELVDEQPEKLVIEKKEALPTFMPNLKRTDTFKSQSESEVSSASSVSSVTTGVLNRNYDSDTDTTAGNFRSRNGVSRNNSHFESATETERDASDGEELPPPPLTPPLDKPPPEELVSEDMKRDFRQKLNLFHEMALRNRGQPKTTEPKFVPSTNL
ncbi:uncharacterized protein LOC100184156 isoform X1 [Ciona intestinalis]